MYVTVELNVSQSYPIASSIKNPSVFFLLRITPYVVPIQDIIIDTLIAFSYTYPIKKGVMKLDM